MSMVDVDEVQKIIDWMDHGEEEAHAKLRAARRVNSETFVRSLIAWVDQLGRTNPALARRFLDRYYLTPAEKGFAEQEVYYAGLLTAEQLGGLAAVHDIEIERSEISRFRIDAKAQILSGAEQHIADNPRKKRKEIRRDVERWIKAFFDKPAKPYTSQQVAAGVNFKLETTKKNLEEKRKRGSRSGSTLVTAKQWKVFLKKTFGVEDPPFRAIFLKAVGDDAREELKLIKSAKSR